MRSSKAFIIAILLLSIVLNGFPVFFPEDLDRDGEVGLKDVILSIKKFAACVDHTDSFGADLEGTLSTIFTAAGIKPSVISGDEKPEVASSNHFFFIASHPFIFIQDTRQKAPETILMPGNSLQYSPPHRPPKSMWPILISNC